MPEDEVQEEGGIKGALTRQIGPLQTWQWALVIVGGYFLYRVLTGKGLSSGGSSDTGKAVGFTSAGDDTTSEPVDLSGVTELLTSQQETINHLVSIADLQKRLDAALNSKIVLTNYINHLDDMLAYYKSSLAKCTTASCKTYYKGKISAYTTQKSQKVGDLNKLNTLISGLQTQITTSTSTTIAAPSTTTPVAASA